MNKPNPRFVSIPNKFIVGKRITMSLTDNKTVELWKSFMPFVNDIPNKSAAHLISMQQYSTSYFAAFNPSNTFEKWAATEVFSFDQAPDGLESFTIPGGLYAVFHYKGLSNDKSVFHYIFTEWLPGSGYILDNRPHFEVLSEKYKNNDPNSEEDIWIPVKKKLQ